MMRTSLFVLFSWCC